MTHPLDPEDYNWEYAFQVAGQEPEDDSGRHYSSVFNYPDINPALPGSEVSLAEFIRADISTIEAYEEGDNEGPDWIVLGNLNDGRWFFLRAGCDYTGWDCQSGGSVDVANDRATLLQYGLTPEEKNRLGLSSPTPT